MIDGHAHPAYARLAERFRRMFAKPDHGGGALAVYVRGEPVVDLWAGHVDADGRVPWQRDTMAMSFSTTKGVASTIVHRLRDRGLLDYDQPVASYWPAFGAAGKDRITVRDLLTHRAGLHSVREHAHGADDLLDSDGLIERLAAAPARPHPEGRPGYHALTYGWLVDGLVRSVTGTTLRELVRTELAEPLELDGLHIGAPRDQRHRVAPLLERPFMNRAVETLAARADRTRRLRNLVDALIVDGFGDLLHDDEQRILDTSMPAANGVFTARSLARMYAGLADGGSVDGVAVLSPETLQLAGRVQTRQRDYVVGFPMQWRLGYHQAFTTGRPPRRGFGHFGYGGSGAWADPESGVALAFVTNRMGGATTPFADARLAVLGSVALAAAQDAA